MTTRHTHKKVADTLIFKSDSVLVRPLLILVGLTGSGKTTTVASLRKAGLDFRLLPNRREVTDRFIIHYLQELDGDPVIPIRDRRQRFAYTRRYRKIHSGGMAHALYQLLVTGKEISDSQHRNSSPDAQFLIFDGLRGENEVIHAIELFPSAHFLFLQAPDSVRVQRLIKRQDVFDAVTANGDVNTIELRRLAANILTDDELNQLLTQAAYGLIDTEALQAKLTIVQSERQNYDLEAALTACQQLAPDRLIIGDTTAYSPDEIAKSVKQRLHTTEW